MEENETSTEALPEVTVNMYPSVKEQVAATALVSLVSIGIPVAALGLLAVAGKAYEKARDWNDARLERKNAKKTALWLPTKSTENE